uniref:Apple domain-containing protein n=2 Tax=Vitrella brassicaformis TaxID=1169539 RepID=A0A7S1KCZ4_9ALVE
MDCLPLLCTFAVCSAVISQSLDRKRFVVEGAVRPYGDGQYEYMHPRPGALHVSELTSIAVREGDTVIPDNLDSLFNVTGEKSRQVKGRTVLARDNKTVVFYADQPFALEENVSVKFGPGLRVRRSERRKKEHEAGCYEWSFWIRTEYGSASVQTILPFDYLDEKNEQEAIELGSIPMNRYRTLPTWAAKWRPSPEGEKAALDPKNKENKAIRDGELYYFGVGGNYGEHIGQSVITTREGDLVWWVKASAGAGMLGATQNGRLALWDQRPNDGAMAVYEVNSTYQVVDRHQMGHGYPLDYHNAFFDEEGNTILTGKTKVNGVLHNVVHVLDASTNVLLEWRSIDDFIDDADPILPGEADNGDVYHINNAERTPDGNLIISLRTCNLVLLISGKTGRILWRMGGRTSDFTFIGEDMDPPFFGQHDARQMANGNIIMYDNGRRWDIGGMRPSRVLELKLDLEKMTATRVWSFTHPSKLSSMCCGGIQIVDNGKGRPQTVLIGWGNGGPFFTEVTHEDRPRIVREFEGLAAHQPLLHHWEGSSTERPRLLLCSDANMQAVEGSRSTVGLQDWTIHFSFNGVTGISKWRLYVGNDSDVSLQRPLIERTKTAFEEIITLQELVDSMAAKNVTPTGDSNATFTDLYVRVVPVKRGGELLRPSKALKVPMAVSSPSAQPVPCSCYQPDIGRREHMDRPKSGAGSAVVDMAAVNECAELCMTSDTCETFFFFEDTGECELDETRDKKRGGLHSLKGVISGRRNCLEDMR